MESKTSGNVLVIGGGAREHALAHKLSLCSAVETVFVSPGNGGTAVTPGLKNVPLSLSAPFRDVIAFVKAPENKVDLVCVGPEVPLVEGIVDVVNSAVGKGICFGPSKQAAQLEGSKAFSKAFMKRNGIPTAKYEVFVDDNSLKAKDYLRSLEKTGSGAQSVVIKYSGLAAGKGVFLPETIEEACAVLEDIFDKKVFVASDNPEEKVTVVIEERLLGEEVSVLAFCEDEDYFIMPYTQDYKRALDGNKGLNTGGMGAHTFHKAKLGTDLGQLKQQIETDVVKRTLVACVKEGIRFSGILYVGLILTNDGPKVLEYNCRFGDPETEVLMPLLAPETGDASAAGSVADLYTIMKHCASEDLKLRSILDKISFKKGPAATLVLTSGGYPTAYEKGKLISGVDQQTCPYNASTGVYVYHAGTKLSEGNSLVTSGGRVLCVSSIGSDARQLMEKVYKEASQISFPEMHFRKDIGSNLL